MYCTQCGVELRADDRFCSRCGKRTGVGRMETSARPLMLDKRNKKIGGVCAGFARYMEVDVILVRSVVAGDCGDYRRGIPGLPCGLDDHAERLRSGAANGVRTRSADHLTPHLISRIITEWSETFCSRSDV